MKEAEVTTVQCIRCKELVVVSDVEIKLFDLEKYICDECIQAAFPRPAATITELKQQADRDNELLIALTSLIATAKDYIAQTHEFTFTRTISQVAQAKRNLAISIRQAERLAIHG